MDKPKSKPSTEGAVPKAPQDEALAFFKEHDIPPELLKEFKAAGRRIDPGQIRGIMLLNVAEVEYLARNMAILKDMKAKGYQVAINVPARTTAKAKASTAPADDFVEFMGKHKVPADLMKQFKDKSRYYLPDLTRGINPLPIDQIDRLAANKAALKKLVDNKGIAIFH